jgi:peptidyl-prolyl cis-trans isomerase D
MLRGIQKATSNWLGRIVVGVILGLIAVSFAIWGIGDIFRGFGQSTVAKIGGREIGVEQFRQTYQDRIQQLSRRVGRPITPDQARALGLDRQVLAQVIAETVLDERARSLRLGVSDQEIARRITEDPNFKGITGDFDRSRFEQLIRQVGYTEARFLAEQKRVTLRQQLVGSVSGDVTVPKTAADMLNRYQNEQRSIEYLVLDRTQAGEVPQPSPEELAKYFEERKVTFRAPEYRKVNVLVLTPAELASGIEVSDADARKAYEERKARYITPERRQVQQIVFPNEEDARAAADKIAKGTSFADIATERGLKDSDIDLGTVTKAGMIDRAVADAAFALKEGEVSAPVQGRFGTALLRVAKIEPGQTRAYEQVAAELKQELATERARATLSDLHDKVEDERLSGATLAELAAKLNLKVRAIDAIDRSGRTPDGTQVADLPENVDVLSAAFTADVGAENDPLQVPGSRGYVWYEVADVKPARERPLEEVRDQVVRRWQDDEIEARLKKKSSEMVEKLKAGTPFAQIAAADKLNVQWGAGIKRGGTPPQGLTVRALDEIFRTPKDGAGSADGASATERVVFRVTEINVPKLDTESAEVKQIDESLRRALAEELTAQYIAKIEKDVGVTINQSALNQVVGGSTN